MIKPSKKILFTFDYELFLGENSGSVSECLLNPTTQIADLLGKYGYKAIFFVDTTYLLRLQEMAAEHPAAAADFALVQAQLRRLWAQNHAICPHIHPHWADATYHAHSNTWQLSELKKYRFHALTPHERAQVFERSIAILKQILPQNQPNAYRAGGWCIQPFADFLPFFKAFGIKYEFSVLPQMRNLTNAQYYDFLEVPPKNSYNFEQDVCVEDPSGSFTQYAISTICVGEARRFLGKILNKCLWRLGYKSFGKGEGVLPEAINDQNKPKNNHEMIAIELLNWAMLPAYNDFLDKNDYMQFISHPKMLTKHNIWCFTRFLKYIHNKFTIDNVYTG